MAMQAEAGVLPDGVISEWRPSGRTLLAWTVLSTPIVIVAWVGYTLVALHGEIPRSGSIGFGQIILVLALTLGLACIHEGIHGVAMFALGARPEFGVLKIGGVAAGLYTTAPGHRFSRRGYLVMGLAPLAVLSPLGIPACLLPFGAYLTVPFAIHLAGCIGDVTIVWHVLRAPSDALCEDMRDGTRFWKPEA